ncbi:MAG: aldolase catalytic domain-containing protein [Elusimicrobia bacterium]|nr:aldolase catalytic domain-containing protein [Candidatus Liberimonas magnetica]
MDKDKKGTLLTYRPDIKILDCTIRDGGLINDHKFDDKFVKAVYETCVSAGINYMEIGYKSSKKIFSKTNFGKWKYCDEDDIREIVKDNKTGLKLSVMADAGRTDYHEDLLPKEKSVIDLIRVACYINQIPTAVDMIQDANDKGYETCLQLMAISVVGEKEITEALEVISKTPASAVYIVDSFGSLYAEQVRDLTKLFLSVLKGSGKEVGIHAHNNQQLAFANTVEALVTGASRLDSTLSGMGRGAGNCSTELIVGFLKNPRFHLRPVLECAEKVMLPMKNSLDWGYSIPYMLTGQLNQHPREAIKWRSGENKDKYVEFYDKMIDEVS